MTFRMRKSKPNATRIVYSGEKSWQIQRYDATADVWRTLLPTFASRDAARTARRTSLELVSLLDEKMVAETTMPAVNTEEVE